MHGCASPGNTNKPRFRRRVPAKKAAGRSSTDQFEFSRLCTERTGREPRRQPAKTTRQVLLAERRAVASGLAALTPTGHPPKLEAMIRGALLDLAGVIYDGDHALPGALSAIERLRQADLSLRFVTNTTRLPKRKVLGRLAMLGLDIRESELFTPGEAAR